MKLVSVLVKEHIKTIIVNGEMYPLDTLISVKHYENPDTWIIEGKKRVCYYH